MKQKIVFFVASALLLVACSGAGNGGAPAARAPVAPAPQASQPEAAEPEVVAPAPAEDEGASGLGLSDEEIAALRADIEQLPAVAPEPAVSATLRVAGRYPYPKRPYLQVTATTDSVSVESVVLNRGNCAIKWGENNAFRFPHTLKFGEAINVPYEGCEAVIEAVVSTNLGTDTFQF